MLNCPVLVALLKTVTRFLSLPVFHMRVAVAIITLHSCPFLSAVYCLCPHSSLLYNHSLTLIYHWLLCPACTISHFCHGALVHYKYN